jgi:hypothetical protein
MWVWVEIGIRERARKRGARQSGEQREWGGRGTKMKVRSYHWRSTRRARVWRSCACTDRAVSFSMNCLSREAAGVEKLFERVLADLVPAANALVSSLNSCSAPCYCFTSWLCPCTFLCRIRVCHGYTLESPQPAGEACWPGAVRAGDANY